MTFNPHFTTVYSIADAADVINRPHEDYPQRVNDTVLAIQTLANLDSFGKGQWRVPNHIVRSTHAMVMPHINHLWRTCPVIIRGVPHPFINIPADMTALADRAITNLDDLKMWYRDFQIIHPFEDGNGRTGGAIFAALSFMMCREDRLWSSGVVIPGC